MKKFFLSFFALVAMVGMANAQRTWAYDLNSTSESGNYTFEFKATTAATTATAAVIHRGQLPVESSRFIGLLKQ
jgi:hypothetical protein